MAKFFFDFHRGNEYCPDLDGCIFASAEDAFLDAFEAAKDMWSEMLGKRQDPRLCAFEIRNERGQIEYFLPFSEVLDSCHDRKLLAPATPGPRLIRDTVRNAGRAQQLIGDLQRELQVTQVTLKKARDIALDSPQIRPVRTL